MNNMTDLLNKIENRLGLSMITLPEKYSKDKWVEVIDRDTLSTFSRYFPHKVTIMIDCCQPRKDGWYLIDYNLDKYYKILGVGDIDFQKLGHVNGGEAGLGMGSGYFDYLSCGLSLDDVGLMQARQDLLSVFNNNIFVRFEYPNRVKFETCNGVPVDRYIKYIPFEVFVKHDKNLTTISPTQMETFESLACSDVAIFLYNNLKFYDGIEIVFGNVNLHMDELQKYAENRESVVEKIESNYVSFSNKNQHLIMSV